MREILHETGWSTKSIGRKGHSLLYCETLNSLCRQSKPTDSFVLKRERSWVGESIWSLRIDFDAGNITRYHCVVCCEFGWIRSSHFVKTMMINLVIYFIAPAVSTFKL